MATPPPSKYLSREEAERLAQQTADFLEARTFTKNPHIGLIGPGTRGNETDPTELLSEAVEERTEQWLSPYVTGFRVVLRRAREEAQRSIKVCYSFSVRVLPPSQIVGGSRQEISENDQFRMVDICFLLKNEGQAASSLVVYDGKRQNVVYDKQVALEIASGRLRVEFPGDEFSDSVSALTTLVETGYPPDPARRTSPTPRFRFCYGFTLVAEIERLGDDLLELGCRLFDEEGRFIDSQGRSIDVTDSNRTSRRAGIVDADNESWSIGQLLEVSSRVNVSGYSFEIRVTEHGVSGLHPVNCAYSLDYLNEGELQFRDFAIVSERGRSIRPSRLKIGEFVRSVVERFRVNFGMPESAARLLSDSESEALRALIRDSEFFYTFQEDCTVKVLESVFDDRSSAVAVPLSVQTAGGKTLGFLVPITMFAYSVNAGGGPPGVKAMLFYPTKALINDQSDTIVKLIWNLNSSLRRSGYSGPLISFGILHGDVPEKRTMARRLGQSASSREDQLRLKCPICGTQMKVLYSKVGESGIAERIFCPNPAAGSCPLSSDEEQISLLNQIVRVTRESVYSSPPDILVTTPDMINFRLFFNPSEQSIFGRKLKRCLRCGYTTANLAERGPCRYCGSSLEGPVSYSTPRILVFDEAHQLRGSFGSQASFVISRLEESIKILGGSRDYHPVYVFSSATLSRPERFIQDFFGSRIPTKPLVKAEYEEGAQAIRRVHLFLVPKGYSPEATLIQALKSVFENFPILRLPNVLVFVNSLAESNELIHLLRHHRSTLIERRHDLPLPQIDGHSTDYGSEQRKEVEDRFTRGEINVLVATRTLEVGVDFEKIDVLVVYGAPFYLSDYVQRIGRAGRTHGALVINVLPDKPIDFFFFGNYPLITNVDVRDRALDVEAVRISRSNETIRRRSAIKALLDYLASRPSAYKYYTDNPKALDELLSALYIPELARLGVQALQAQPGDSDLNPELYPYIERALRFELSESEKKRVRRTIQDLLEAMVQHGTTSISSVMAARSGFLDRIRAGDLRQSDNMVSIDHPDLAAIPRTGGEDETSRERSLGMAIGSYAPGQITSYRSLFFVVDHVEGDPALADEIRSAIYRDAPRARRDDP